MKTGRQIAIALLLGAGALAGCTPAGTERPGSAAAEATAVPSKAAAIDSAVQASLLDLYRAAPGAQALVEQAAGVLVFPSITEAGFIAGVEYGQGALRVGDRITGYYSITGGSVGLTAGVQQSAQAILFTTQQSLNDFLNSNGWTVGVDASVALLKVGAGGTIDTQTANSPVQAIVYNTSGLMADVAISGQRITRINP